MSVVRTNAKYSEVCRKPSALQNPTVTSSGRDVEGVGKGALGCAWCSGMQSTSTEARTAMGEAYSQRSVEAPEQTHGENNKTSHRGAASAPMFSVPVSLSLRTLPQLPT